MLNLYPELGSSVDPETGEEIDPLIDKISTYSNEQDYPDNINKNSLKIFKILFRDKSQSVFNKGCNFLINNP